MTRAGTNVIAHDALHTVLRIASRVTRGDRPPGRVTSLVLGRQLMYARTLMKINREGGAIDLETHGPQGGGGGGGGSRNDGSKSLRTEDRPTAQWAHGRRPRVVNEAQTLSGGERVDTGRHATLRTPNTKNGHHIYPAKKGR